jgi:peptidyl-prolyl cis-trans isomerase C
MRLQLKISFVLCYQALPFKDVVLTRFFFTLFVAITISGATACRKPPTGSAQSTAAAPVSSTPGVAATAGQPGQPAAPPAAKPMPAQLPDVLARVNGEVVTKVDFDRLIKNMEVSANQPVPPEKRDEIFRRALDQLVTYTVLTQETRARKIAVTDAEIDENLKQMRSQFPNEDAFTKALAARGMTMEKLKSDAKIDMSINKMMEAEMANQTPPTDAQVREFYDKNPDKFKQDEAVRASHILFRVPANADAATKKKALDQAQSVLKQARAGADFAELAKKYSADGSAQQGGDLNFFTKGQMVPEFDQTAFALKTGEISDIVTTQFGYHIIKLTDRRAPSTVPFEQVSPRIKEYLTEQQKQQKGQAFIESLKQKAKIEVLV